jgi:hypothetical protein
VTYRDDRDAAVAQADALRRRLADTEAQLAEAERARAAAASERDELKQTLSRVLQVSASPARPVHAPPSDLAVVATLVLGLLALILVVLLMRAC